ncbi:MAG: hypothetical protein ACRC7N_09845, partial [Clostridium sp.]
PTGSIGSTGPIGATGNMGATGPQGVTGVPAKISILNSSLFNPNLSTIPFQGVLSYNTILFSYCLSSSGITAPSNVSILPNGLINITTPGIYDFSFTLNLSNTPPPNNLSFDIVQIVNGTPIYFNPLVHAEFNATETFIVGELALSVSSPMTVAIINSSINTITLPASPNYKGELKIVGYTLS